MALCYPRGGRLGNAGGHDEKAELSQEGGRGPWGEPLLPRLRPGEPHGALAACLQLPEAWTPSTAGRRSWRSGWRSSPGAVPDPGLPGRGARPRGQVLDAVQQGTVEAGHTYGPFYVGKNPALAFDGGVPFGLTYRQHNAWMLMGGGLSSSAGSTPTSASSSSPGNTGTQMGAGSAGRSAPWRTSRASGCASRASAAS